MMKGRDDDTQMTRGNDEDGLVMSCREDDCTQIMRFRRRRGHTDNDKQRKMITNNTLL